MTSPGRHAATDGSFSKSAGSALFRGGGLVALAVLIGLVLLYWVYDNGDQGGYTIGTDGSSQAEASTDGDNGDGAGATTDDDTTDGDNADDGTPTSTPPEETTPPVSEPDEPEDDTGPKPPEETVALAVNGVGTKGLAGKLQGELNTLNYKTDAANLSGKATDSVVYFKAGFKRNARDIADALGWPPSVIKKFPDDGSVVLSSANERVDAADIVLVIGADGIYQ